ncbi:hypothetical protein WJX74_001099 [Apatococcus lobatus]|uniref:Uncharacterized protein n=1 Tax=Apatococcus lobatus TaxID=904363 RepID=A0AAW1RXX5_9CHLO
MPKRKRPDLAERQQQTKRLRAAVSKVQAGGSLCHVSKEFDIAKTTLQGHSKNPQAVQNPLFLAGSGGLPALPLGFEDQVQQQVFEFHKRGLSLTPDQLRAYIKDFRNQLAAKEAAKVKEVQDKADRKAARIATAEQRAEQKKEDKRAKEKAKQERETARLEKAAQLEAHKQQVAEEKAAAKKEAERQKLEKKAAKEQEKLVKKAAKDRAKAEKAAAKGRALQEKLAAKNNADANKNARPRTSRRLAGKGR